MKIDFKLFQGLLISNEIEKCRDCYGKTYYFVRFDQAGGMVQKAVKTPFEALKLYHCTS